MAPQRFTEPMIGFARLLCSQLGLESAFTMRDLAARLEQAFTEELGRRCYIILIPQDMVGPLFGMCMVTAGRIFTVYYKANTNWLHQERILGHELGHIVCGHLFGLPDGMALIHLRDGSQHSWQENEAEEFSVAINALASSPREARAALQHRASPYGRFLDQLGF